MPAHSNIWVTFVSELHYSFKAKIKTEIADWMYVATIVTLEGKG